MTPLLHQLSTEDSTLLYSLSTTGIFLMIYMKILHTKKSEEDRGSEEVRN